MMHTHEETSSEVLFKGQCPSCGSPKGYVEYSDGHTFCFSCRNYTPPTKEEHEETTMTAKEEPKGILQGRFTGLPSRGIRAKACEKLGYQVTSDGTEIAIYYRGSAPVAQKCRKGGRKDDTYWAGSHANVDLFGQHAWPSKGKRVVVTEGEIDALSVCQALGHTWPVVSIQNGAGNARKSLEAALSWLEGYETIVLAFDADKPGRDAIKECADMFTPGKVKIMSYTGACKDANDVLVKHGEAALKTACYDATSYRPDGIVSGMDLVFEDLLEDPVMSYETPYDSLNKLIRGVRKSEICLLTAGSGIGKSTAATEIAYKLLMYDKLQVAHIALEESIKDTERGYIGIHLDAPKSELSVNPKFIDKEVYRQAFKDVIQCGRWWTHNHFGSLDGDNLLAKIRFMAVSLKVDFVILDHISIVVSGMESSREGERKDIDKLMTSLRSLCQETNIGIIAIVHLKRTQGKPFNEGGQVSLSDLRGSGSLEQLSDTVVALERDQQGDSPTVAFWRVLKNRRFSITGPAGAVNYNLETGRLLPYEEPNAESNKSDPF